MKATINEKGCLTVEAETPLEAYALKKWVDEFRPLDPSGCESTFLVVTSPIEETSFAPAADSPLA